MNSSAILVRRLLGWVGSLWFAAVLLVLLLVALACGTVYESMHGTGPALATFYLSPWFTGLLALLAINMIAAVLVRWPLPKAKYPFALTHVSIIVILIGALVTKFIGVDGQVALNEGQTSDVFLTREQVITLHGATGGAPASLVLPESLSRGAQPVDRVRGAQLAMGDTRLEVLRYLPDSAVSTEVTNDAPEPRRAVEVRLSSSGHEQTAWVLADETQAFGTTRVALTILEDEASLRKRLEAQPESGTSSVGRVLFEIEGTTYGWPVEACRARPVDVGDTGLTLRVIDYFPHANVGAGGRIHSVSDRPENPAIRVEITGPSGTQRRTAFARFPDFSSMHGDGDVPDAKLTFEFLGGKASPSVPIEVLAAPGAPLHVRFAPTGGPVRTEVVSDGVPIDTPWPGTRFEVVRAFDHAQRRRLLEPVEPARETGMPGVLVALRNGQATEEVWLQKYEKPLRTTVGGEPVELRFGDRNHPLGFSLTLNKFTVGYYPGTGRPRSFESQITIDDARMGGTVSRIVSMNHPTAYNGYTLFQSSYKISPGRTMSILSVAKDPGLPVVFAGYIGLMAGMVGVLVVRMRARRGAGIGGVDGSVGKPGGVRVSLLRPGDRCINDVPVGAGGGIHPLAATVPSRRATSPAKSEARQS